MSPARHSLAQVGPSSRRPSYLRCAPRTSSLLALRSQGQHQVPVFPSHARANFPVCRGREPALVFLGHCTQLDLACRCSEELHFAKRSAMPPRLEVKQICEPPTSHTNTYRLLYLRPWATIILKVISALRVRLLSLHPIWRRCTCF